MFNEYPYRNLTDVNLDFILKHIRDLTINLQDFIKLNTIKYADPIDWNISKQYEANTVVVNDFTGIAYLSTKPVPSGVDVTNTDYWTPIFTLDFVNMNKNITLRNDGNNNNATFASTVDDWLIVGGQLYKVIQDIALHTAYVVGYNIQIYSVDLFVHDYLNQVLNLIGDLQELNTSDKTSVVNAINSVLSDINTKIGDLDDLTTSDKTSVVNAINETVNNINDINDEFGYVAYKKVSDCTGDTDTEKLQNAVNTYDFVLLDSDITISTVNITKPVKLNLGGHQVTSTTEDENTINIIANEVEIFNGKIYTTVNTPNNYYQYGSCIYTLNKPSFNPSLILHDISLHDLELSSNAAQTVVLLGEIYNSEVYNIVFDGDRTNVTTELDAINIEWRINAETPATGFHPHNIKLRNLTFNNYTLSNNAGIGLRTAGAFNLTIENIYAYNCDCVIALTPGDFGGSTAPVRYKTLVNGNIIINNIDAVNCNTAILAVGITSYDYGRISFNAKNVTTTTSSRKTGGAINTTNAYDSKIENIKCIGLFEAPYLIRGLRIKLSKALTSGSAKWGVYCEGNYHIFDECIVEDANQDNDTGLNSYGMVITGNLQRVHNCIVSIGNNDNTQGSIRLSANNSIVTDNICFKTNITNLSTGSVVDNNIESLS